MSDQSAIEWTDATWNPTTGCTKISPACAHCYIERTPPFRINGRKFIRGHIPIALHPDRLAAPLSWKKPRRVFVDSLSDLFHRDISDEFIDRVFAVMAVASQHTYQVLTKRTDRMRAYMESRRKSAHYWKCAVPEGWALEWQGLSLVPFPLPNVWLGASVENQAMADKRLIDLCETPAAVRFVSAEPLLGPISFRGMWKPQGLDWVIVGAESGPRVRPTDPAWVRDIRDQCVAARVPFFFKQWGGKTPKSGGRELDGRTWDEYPR